MAKLRGLSPDHTWVKKPDTAQEMLRDPDKFFQNNPVKAQDYACPPETHQALERGRLLGEAIKASCSAATAAKLTQPEAVKRLRDTVAQHFGQDFVAESVPYGILFKERATGAAAAVTGTGSCTFCADNDSPDVD